MTFRILALALVAAVPSVCLAQTPEAPAPSGDTRRLTDAQRDAILDSNTIESAARARGEMDGSDAPGRAAIHGEVGAMVGSNGLRSVYGAAEIPLGGNAGAAVSFESTRFGGYRRSR
ncbi:hypothetical protein BH10PSE15_BH10PSE15_05840 [soil metagenome]